MLFDIQLKRLDSLLASLQLKKTIPQVIEQRFIIKLAKLLSRFLKSVPQDRRDEVINGQSGARRTMKFIPNYFWINGVGLRPALHEAQCAPVSFKITIKKI